MPRPAELSDLVTPAPQPIQFSNSTPPIIIHSFFNNLQIHYLYILPVPSTSAGLILSAHSQFNIVRVQVSNLRAWKKQPCLQPYRQPKRRDNQKKSLKTIKRAPIPPFPHFLPKSPPLKPILRLSPPKSDVASAVDANLHRINIATHPPIIFLHLLPFTQHVFL